MEKSMIDKSAAETSAQDKYLFSLPMKVRDYEVDSQGIVNNAVYLHYMEHTRHEFCQWAGTTFRDMQQEGLDPVLREVHITYLSPLRLGEEFVSRLNLRRDGARFVFDQEIVHHPSGTPAARAEVTVVTLQNGRLTKGDRLAEAFAEYLK